MSVPQQDRTAGQPTRQEEFNKSLVERAFQDVFASDAFDESAIARYFSPRYVQKTDGRTLDFPGFVAHVRELNEDRPLSSAAGAPPGGVPPVVPGVPPEIAIFSNLPLAKNAT